MTPTIKINYPIWATRSVGISDNVLANYPKLIRVEILYESKRTGLRIYPNIYTMSRDKAIKYPTQLQKGIRLYIIPIEDFEIEEDKKEDRVDRILRLGKERKKEHKKQPTLF